MKRATLVLAAMALLVGGVGQAKAGYTTLTFDDLPAFTQVGEQYASKGVHFSLGDSGVQEGLANGDPGGWGLNGTNGPYFAF